MQDRYNTTVRIGTSGWNYHHWKGIFYPQGLSQKKWLEFYATYFDTVELNVTFYRFLPARTFQNWYSRTPDNFTWSVKASRKITHHARLENIDSIFNEFLASVKHLGNKLGPILFQLPPSLKYDPEKQGHFLSLASTLPFPVLEVRHKSWLQDKVIEDIRSYGIALCVSHSRGRFPYMEAVTSHFAYVRLHGPDKLYSSEYSSEELERWAHIIRTWRVPTFVYFNNDFQGFAVKNALELKRLFENV